jgi:hypothetical protein
MGGDLRFLVDNSAMEGSWFSFMSTICTRGLEGS